MSVYEKGLTTTLVLSAVVALIALPLWLRKIGPNPVYGFRTRRSLSREDVWYEANAVFGRAAFLGAFVSAAFEGLLYRHRWFEGTAYMNAGIAGVMIPLTVAAVLAQRAAAAMDED